ncbi:MAG: prepilin-type N-terminal cleavage/methylation domain-containing protein [Deltaproteobacteria bacterium]
MTEIWKRKNKQGMTLIEILVALAIFTISFLVLIDAQNLNIRSSAHAHRMSIATILAQDKMTETLLKHKDTPLREIEEKEDGTFEGTYSKYRWEITSRDFAYDLSFLIAMAQGGGETEEETRPPEAESPLLAYLPKISQFIKNSSKEMTVTVFWREGATERNVSLTTHLFNYKTPLPL